jgi:hypothetical protein
MLHIVKNTNLIIKRTPLLCSVLLAAVFILLPISAQAQCTNWHAGGDLSISQPGLGVGVLFWLRLTQKGRVITGTADYDGIISDRYQTIAGTVEGTLDGNSFSVQIFWQNGLTGVYNAKVLPTGRLDGEAYEKSTPNIRVSWHSLDVLKCATAGPSKGFKITSKITLPPSPPPIRRSGKARPAEPAPPPPPMKVPGIVASQVIFEPPYPTGFVILTWDGGPDHPYAEVWVKVGEGDETFVVEQGKGERRVIVERNRTYLYILTDAGKTLSTDRVNVPPY